MSQVTRAYLQRMSCNCPLTDVVITGDSQVNEVSQVFGETGEDVSEPGRPPGSDGLRGRCGRGWFEVLSRLDPLPGTVLLCGQAEAFGELGFPQHVRQPFRVVRDDAVHPCPVSGSLTSSAYDTRVHACLSSSFDKLTASGEEVQILIS